MKTIRRTPVAVQNAVFDLRYGAPLGGRIRSRYAELGAYDVANSDYSWLSSLFARVEVAHDDVLVDVGCGKGRALNWFLSHYPTNEIYGIELDPEVCATTSRRLRRFSNVTVLCGDATRVLPEHGTLFYLYNPFNEAVMKEFIEAVTRTESATRPKRFVYNNCKFLRLFREDPRFEVKVIDTPSLRHPAALVVLNG